MLESNLARFTCLMDLSPTLRFKVQFVTVALHRYVLRVIQTVFSVFKTGLFSFIHLGTTYLLIFVLALINQNQKPVR